MAVRAGGVMIEPGGISTRADLHAALAELHRTDPGQRSFHELASDAGIDGVATIHGMIKGTSFPRRQTLARVLVAWGIPKTQHEPWFRAYERATKDNSIRLGRPLAEVLNPFDLEVHRSITLPEATELPALPPYVAREHDQRLAEIVQRAVSGESAMAVLVAGSSAGKTRALWEALALLRDAGGWRLWHPLAPTRSQALDELAQVKSRTVVWLNESQEYLGDVKGTVNESITVAFEKLLADPDRAPVLVLGTLWPGHYARLRENPASQVRKLLEDRVISVPEAFSGQDLAALNAVASNDPRLKKALEKAKDGQVTQYLAGGPELVDRYRFASSPEAKAVIEAAMDARRMGHRPELSFSFLRDAAPAYMTDTQWNLASDNWLEQALSETCQPCKGAPGPVTRIRSRPMSRMISEIIQTDSPAMYHLADYLEQYGSTHRREHIPPIGFWQAALMYAHPGDLTKFASSAWSHGFYRDAVQMWKNAAVHGDHTALQDLVLHVQLVFPNDRDCATWAVEHCSLESVEAVAGLLEKFRYSPWKGSKLSLLARNPASHMILKDASPSELGDFLSELLSMWAIGQIERLENSESDRVLDAENQIATLLARNPATLVTLSDPFGVATMLQQLQWLSTSSKITAELANFPSLGLSHATMQAADDQIAALIARVSAQTFDVANTLGVESLARALDEVGSHTQAEVLRVRISENVDLSDPYRMAELIQEFHEVGADAALAVLLARNPAAHVTLDQGLYKGWKGHTYAVAQLLRALLAVGADDQVVILLNRNPAERLPMVRQCGGFDRSGDGVLELLTVLRDLGVEEQVKTVWRRLSEFASGGNAGAIAHLLRGASLDQSACELLVEYPADSVVFEDPDTLADLLEVLDAIQAHHYIGELIARNPAEHLNLSGSTDLDRLIEEFGRFDAHDQIAKLDERLPLVGRMFQLSEEARQRFRYGREPDGTPAVAWTWHDLA